MSSPGEVYEIFKQLRQDFFWMNRLELFFKTIYEVSEDKGEALDSVIPSLLFTFRYLIISEIQQSIGRVMEKENLGKSQNVSVFLYGINLKNVSGKDHIDGFVQKFNEMVDIYNEIKLNRNKILAHSDLNNLLSSGSNSTHEFNPHKLSKFIELYSEYIFNNSSDEDRIIFFKKKFEEERYIKLQINCLLELIQSSNFPNVQLQSPELP
jgi:hypothetical protein